MRNAIAVGTVGLGLSFAMLAFGYLAGSGTIAAERPSTPMAAAQIDRGQIQDIVRDYLIANPGVMLEVQAALEAKQDEDRRLAQTDKIENSSDLLFNANYDGLIGNPDGNVTVVEFFDYNCTYCRHALSDMEALVKTDPQLRFVMKEFPILGPDSQKAHVVSMAFRTLAPEKYAKFHEMLLGQPGRAGEASAIKVALSLGVDEAALREEMKDPRITIAFDETYKLANDLAITGTPSYVVGKQVIFGAQGEEALAQKIEELRACGTTATC